MKKVFVYRVAFWIRNEKKKVKFYFTKSFYKQDDAMSLISILKDMQDITDIYLNVEKTEIDSENLPF